MQRTDDAELGYKKKLLFWCCVVAFCGFCVVIKLNDEWDLFHKVPMNDIQMWHNSYSPVLSSSH